MENSVAQKTFEMSKIQSWNKQEWLLGKMNKKNRRDQTEKTNWEKGAERRSKRMKLSEEEDKYYNRMGENVKMGNTRNT